MDPLGSAPQGAIQQVDKRVQPRVSLRHKAFSALLRVVGYEKFSPITAKFTDVGLTALSKLNDLSSIGQSNASGLTATWQPSKHDLRSEMTMTAIFCLFSNAATQSKANDLNLESPELQHPVFKGPSELKLDQLELANIVSQTTAVAGTAGLDAIERHDYLRFDKWDKDDLVLLTKRTAMHSGRDLKDYDVVLNWAERENNIKGR